MLCLIIIIFINMEQKIFLADEFRVLCNMFGKNLTVNDFLLNSIVWDKSKIHNYRIRILQHLSCHKEIFYLVEKHTNDFESNYLKIPEEKENFFCYLSAMLVCGFGNNFAIEKAIYLCQKYFPLATDKFFVNLIFKGVMASPSRDLENGFDTLWLLKHHKSLTFVQSWQLRKKLHDFIECSDYKLYYDLSKRFERQRTIFLCIVIAVCLLFLLV